MTRTALAALLAAIVLAAAGCGPDSTAEGNASIRSTEAAEGVATEENATATETAESGGAASSDAVPSSSGDASASDGTESDSSDRNRAGAPAADDIDAERFPIVIDAQASPQGANSWRFDVTLSSEYDTPERYADAWRVLDADGTELGIRVLTHDHANEQPFTRSTTVDVPADVATVFVEGRDQDNGWSGQRYELELAAASGS